MSATRMIIETNPAMILSRERKDFGSTVVYADSDSDDETCATVPTTFKTSHNIVDYVRSREMSLKNVRKVHNDFGTRHLLTHEKFKECNLNLGITDCIKCSQWLTDKEIVFGTLCGRLMVYNVTTHALTKIPTLAGSHDIPVAVLVPETNCILSVQLNPSKTLLAINTWNPCYIAIYKIPTFKPVWIGECVFTDRISSICWLDDVILVSGTSDSKILIWRITSDILVDDNEGIPIYHHMITLSENKCKYSKTIEQLCFNKTKKELAALTFVGTLNIWNAERFRQIFSFQLPFKEHYLCMAVQDPGLYAVGCSNSTLLFDYRTLKVVKEISYNGLYWGITSTSFHGDILTTTTSEGLLMFYDVRASKLINSVINPSTKVGLKVGCGHVKVNEKYIDSDDGFLILTHCYDSSGTRLFTAGGRMGTDYRENYASLWL